MSSPQNINNAYDFFTPIEDAVGYVFAANGITCYTPTSKLDASNADPVPENPLEFQKKRPRIEAVFGLGASGTVLYPEQCDRAEPGHLRALDRSGSLTLKLITEPNIVLHRQYLAMILFLVDTLARDINNTRQLTRFYIQSMKISGANHDDDASQGSYATELEIDTNFSVNPNAIAALGN